MSTYEIVVIIFLSMTFTIGLVRFIIYIVDKFSRNRK